MEPLVIAIKSARERSAFAWRRAVLAAPSPGAAHGVILDSRACDRNYLAALACVARGDLPGATHQLCFAQVKESSAGHPRCAFAALRVVRVALPKAEEESVTPPRNMLRNSDGLSEASHR